MKAQPVPMNRLEWLWRGPGWPPAAFAVAVAAFQVAGSHLAGRGQPDRDPVDAVAVALLAAGPLALLARRRYPVAVVWVVIGVTLAYMLLGYPYGPVLLSAALALYANISGGHRLAAWSAAGALYGGHFGLRALLDVEPPSVSELLIVGAWMLLMLVGCEAARVRRERVLEAERTRAEEARRRASDERLGIARELHDVIAHHISLMNVQAGVALHLMDKRPEQARIALTAIEAASREAMGELRSVLSILSRPDEQAPLAPAPSLARVDGLASQAAAAGVEVKTEVTGIARALPAPVDAAAFRIVQEALTNVIRHAGSSATVQIGSRRG